MDETLLRLANATGVVAFALGLAGSTLIGPTPRHPRSQWFMRSLAGSAALMAGVFLLVLGLSPAAIASSLAASDYAAVGTWAWSILAFLVPAFGIATIGTYFRAVLWNKRDESFKRRFGRSMRPPK